MNSQKMRLLVITVWLASWNVTISAEPGPTGDGKPAKMTGVPRQIKVLDHVELKPLFETRAATVDPVDVVRKAWKGYLTQQCEPVGWTSDRKPLLRFYFDNRALPWARLKHHPVDGMDNNNRNMGAHAMLHEILGEAKENDPIERGQLAYLLSVTDPSVGLPYQVEQQPRTCALGHGELAKNIILMYEQTREPRFKEWAKQMLDTMRRYAQVSERDGIGKVASFNQSDFAVGSPPKQHAADPSLGGWHHLVVGWDLWAFSKWYELTGDEAALDFAIALANRLMNSEDRHGDDGSFRPDGSFGGKSPTSGASWHMHAHTHCLPGMCHLARQLIKKGDREKALELYGQVDHTFQWLYDPARNPDAGSMTGWLGEVLLVATGWDRRGIDCEGCTMGDIVDIACRLGSASHLDPRLAHQVEYYDRAEQIFRGQLMESIFRVTPRYQEVVRQCLERRIAKEITRTVSWNDRSASGNHVERMVGEPNKSANVSTIKNLPAVRFNAKSYGLLKSSEKLRLKEFTVIAVLNVADKPGGSFFSNYDNPINWGKGFNLEVTQDRKVYFFTTGGTKQTYDRMWSNRALSEGFHIVTVTYDSSQKRIYGDGELIGKKASQSIDYGKGTVAAVGALREFGEFFNSDLSELIVYDQVEGDQRTATESYLSTKYAIRIPAVSETQEVGKPVLWLSADRGFDVREEVAGMRSEELKGRYERSIQAARKMEGRLLGLCGFPDWVNHLPSTLDAELPGIDMMGCCSDAVIRAGHAIWTHGVTGDDEVTRVNLAFNRDSPQLTINSCLPHRGELNITVKKTRKVLVRVPSWARKDRVLTLANRKPNSVTWEGAYVVFDQVTAGDQLTVTYPLRMAQVREPINGVLYTQTWRGNTIVDIKPGGKWIPMFRRPQLNTEQVPTR